MTRAGIVADDLTGAADSAVQFARAGWRARLVLGGEPTPESDGSRDPDAAFPVTALVTDSRALEPAAAHAATAAAVEELIGRGVERVLLKVDSTMRGSIADQVSGALEAWRSRHPLAFAVVSPAYPALGRTVEGGRVLVDGAGVETTSVGRDPVTPVATSAMAELLPGSVHVAVGDGDARDLAARLVAAAVGRGVITLEGADDADLALTAEAIRFLGDRVVPVGSAGLAIALSRAWAVDSAPNPLSDTQAAPSRLVVVLSSLHDASREQYAHLVTNATASDGPSVPGVRTVAPTLAEIHAGDLDRAVVRAGAPTDDERIVVVLAPSRGTSAMGAGVETGSGPTDAERVADALAGLTQRVVEDLDDVGLVLVGGEGARAVLRRLGATAVRVVDAVREGVPRGTLEGGRWHGTPVVTKAGGFGPVSTLTDIVSALLGIPSIGSPVPLPLPTPSRSTSGENRS